MISKAMKTRQCFFLVPIEKGVEYMGYWLGIELVAQIMLTWNPVLFITNLIALAFWGMMKRKDTAKNRRNFFYTVSIWVSAFFIYFTMNWYATSIGYAELKESCEDAKAAAEDDKKGSGKDVDDCMADAKSTQ